ncbi:MAG: hypothetical protein IIB00_07490 [candidate division Zixibacteria bacterium]|nr:hypothetical protein [candidate division Zixibacteria bacterium]
MKSRITTNMGNQLICVSRSMKENTRRENSFLSRFVALSLIIASLAIFSCSSTDNVIVSAQDSSKAVGALTYFPVSTGYVATFSITDENGADIGSEIYIGQGATTVNGLPGIRWTVTKTTDSNNSESGAIYWDDSAIYHIEDGNEVAEIILQEPFVYGASWNRWVNTSIDPDTNTVNNDGGTANENNILDSDSTNGGISFSSFPTKGQSTFYVASTEDGIEVNGEILSGCLQIINAGVASTVNRYWYCPGIGLVKYALECDFGSTTGKVNGEKVG